MSHVHRRTADDKDVANGLQALIRVLERLRPGGVLAIGKSEQFPAESRELTTWNTHFRLYRHR